MADSTNSSANSGMSDAALEKLMQKGFDQLSKADKQSANSKDDKTIRMLGIEVPEVVGTVVYGLWNDLSSDIGRWIKGDITRKPLEGAARALNLSGTKLVKSVAATQIALATLVQSGPYLSPIRKAYKDKEQARTELVKKAAPLLDSVKGRHTMGALMGIKEKDNEMLFYARERMRLTASTGIKNSWTNLAVNVAPSILRDYPDNKRIWKNQPLDAGIDTSDQKFQRMFGKVISYGVAPIANIVTRGNERKLKQKIASPYSAFDMVQELAAQVESNPKASSFQLPGKHSGSVALEKYLEQIIEMHQKNMAEINPDHVEIRPALKEDISAAVKPLAEAIRKGEMNVMSLAELIGGKIIKNRGRAVASPEEVEDLLVAEKSKPAALKHADPKTYYKDKPYTKDDLKKVIDSEHRSFVVSRLPVDVAKDLGISEDEARKSQQTPDALKRETADIVVGVHEQAQDTLKKSMGKAELRNFDKAYESIKKGEQPHGIEQDTLNYAVSTILGDKAHFGTVLEQGHAKFDEMQAESAEGKHAHAAQKGAGHRDDIDFSDENAGHHARREHHRAEQRQGEHSYLD